MIIAADVRQLAKLAQAEACRHEPRTPQRRAACALWTALVTTDSVDGARRALRDFAAREVQAAAIALLYRSPPERHSDRR